MGMLDLEMTMGNIQQLIELKKKSMKQTLNLDTMLQISMLYRQLGCGLLLARYDDAGFTEKLTTSAKIYLYYLDHQAEDPMPDAYYRCRSRAEPFLDAVAANALTVALDMSAKMPSEWTL